MAGTDPTANSSLTLAKFLSLLSSLSLKTPLVADSCSSPQQEDRVQEKERLLDDPLYLFAPGCFFLQTTPGISPEQNSLWTKISQCKCCQVISLSWTWCPLKHEVG